MTRSVWAAGLIALAVMGGSAVAQDLIVEKKVFELPSYTTTGGQTIKAVKIGWEAAGTLNADKSNAILITHFFSGTSHAFGKYKAEDKAAGYWDAIIGPGKAIDTNKFYVISSDTLVNLNARDPLVTTTGPASINPDTGKPYGASFPLVTIRDFVNVQKALVESLGIKKLHAVAGASMGGLQAYEWAAGYPEMVGRVMPVISAGEASGNLIGWLDIWAAPIHLDAKFKNGDYDPSDPPNDGLALALKIVTLHANHSKWANAAFGRKWAGEGKEPGAAMANRYAIESTLDAVGKARAATSDANHFLYLAKANQTFVAGGESKTGLAKIKAPVLVISNDEDLVFAPQEVADTVAAIKAGGASVEHLKLTGTRGHLDGVLTIQQHAKAIADFMAK